MTTKPIPVTLPSDEQIKHMVERFLSWKLPVAEMSPDCGISITRPNYAPNVLWEPTGTNFLDYTQATAMVRHMVEGLPTMRAKEPVAVEGLVEAIDGLTDELENLRDERASFLNEVAVMMSEFVDNWPNPKKSSTSLKLIAKTLRAALSTTPSPVGGEDAPIALAPVKFSDDEWWFFSADGRKWIARPEALTLKPPVVRCSDGSK